MNYFYSNRIEDRIAYLDETESKHALKVLRMKAGDPVWMVDGQGRYYRGIIREPAPGKCKVEIQEQKKEAPPSRPNLHILIAPPKQSDRFEWFLEKATEIGVDEISPVWCDHSERKKLNLARCERVLIAAMKQSGRATLPRIHELQSFRLALDNKNENSLWAIAQHGGEPMENILRPSPPSLTILIGPEGDFSREEIDLCRRTGALNVSLGAYRLRTETAGVVAAAIVNRT